MAINQALAQCLLPKVVSAHRNMKTITKTCFLMPGLQAFLSARCGVTAAPRGRAGRAGTSEILFGAKSALEHFTICPWGMACAVSCTKYSCVPDPTPLRVLLRLYPTCTYLPKQIFILKNSLCFGGKCAFRHLRALKSAPVLKCGTFNYQRKENRGLLCQVQALLSTWGGASWHWASSQGAVTPSPIPSLPFNRLPMVRFVELQLLKSFYSYGFCSKDSITKTENVRVSLAADWQLSPLLVKGWRRPLHAE